MSRSEREHPRYAHEAAVRLHAGNIAVEGRTRNVSRGGLCADLVEPVAVGIDIMVDLVLVFDEATRSDALRLPARVVWCTELDEAHQVGIAFRQLDARRAEHLELFLRHLDQGRAEKPPRAATIDDQFG